VTHDTEDDAATSEPGLDAAVGERPARQASNRIHIGGDVAGNVVAGGSNVVGDVVVFVGVALGSGIIGNVAYDALKATVKKLVPRSRSSASYGERTLIARTAVQKRCAEVDFPIPGPDDPCDVRWDADDASYTYHLTFHHVVAKVVIPKGALDGRELQVTLHTHADQSELARARTETNERRRRKSR
jgi:hypothetical protein